ncbi:sensor histidine kinase [[Clostridium] polysaccharolyticum]|uniref:Histidine kinase-, DNA gyrase B-, and HSP90-like ATPase n=1 Tax=[Clostridium] polysaccharolyticum TaxID=29364 RepID=A0A1H9Z903_9FIRM|nr:histidine kinase [[Clostridium] polysaccharolyticum]SES77940.1 Histidine kinase-, DNA gyrase B-, and HSP90-like ATPase [[Clostridium] polysaccharolyticum]
MKKRGILESFLLEFMALGSCVVVLWTAFYCLTMQIMKKNMIAQVQASSDAIISRVENELLEIGDAAYRLSHAEKVCAMLEAEDKLDFYDLAGNTENDIDTVIGQNILAGNILILRRDGGYYRFRGRISNTVIKKMHRTLIQDGVQNFTVSTNGMTYIVCSHEVCNKEDVQLGYVVFLMEKTNLESILGDFHNLKHLGLVLLSGNTILCANQEIDENMLAKQKDASIFYQEKTIGFTGFRLLVLCRSIVTKQVRQYFGIAVPVTIVLLFLVMAGFVSYWKKHFIHPLNSVLAHFACNMDMPLPLTGEEYFDGLVKQVNAMIFQIEEKEKELYESKMRVKDIELEKERTIFALLKKQINAHFTVNTLNVVRAFIYRGDREEAVRLCNELSCLLRYANGGDGDITLLEEIHVLEQYVGIMQTRYPGKFQFKVEMDEELLDTMIPRMILQPLVENAIVHGLCDRTGEICIRAEKNEKMVIQVIDNGRGMSKEEISAIQERIWNQEIGGSGEMKHIALMNIDRRIKMVYGEESGIWIDSEKEKGTKVLVMWNM